MGGDPFLKQLVVTVPVRDLVQTRRSDAVFVFQAGEDLFVQHPADADEVVLFSFKSKAFFGKKKVRAAMLQILFHRREIHTLGTHKTCWQMLNVEVLIFGSQVRGSYRE